MILKYIKKIKILTLVVFFSIFSIRGGYTTGNTTNIINIEVISSKSIDINILGDSIIKKSQKMESDLYIYHDINIRKTKISKKNEKKITLFFDETLKRNNNYTVLAVTGIQGIIDFNTDKKSIRTPFLNKDIENNTQGIKKIIITENNTMELYFLQKVGKEIPTFKLYNHIEVTSLKYNNKKRKISITIDKKIKEHKKYLIHVTYFQAENKKKIVIKNQLHTLILQKNIKKYSLKKTTSYNKESEENYEFNSAKSKKNNQENYIKNIILLTYILIS